MKPLSRFVISTGLALSVVLVIAAPAGATVYMVMPGIDPDSTPCQLAAAGAGTCSLREALAAVDAGSGGDTIMLPAGNYPNIQGAEFAISKSVTILGAGSATTTVNGSPSSRVFDVTQPVVVTISDVTITGGNAVGGSFSGGGVEVSSGTGNPALLMSGDAVVNNGAELYGGGIDLAHNGGSLTLSDSLVANNQILGQGNPQPAGGGIVLAHGGTLTNVTVTGNSNADTASTLGGGGIENLGGGVTIASSTIAGNSSSGPSGNESGGNLGGNSVTILDSIVAGGVGPAGSQNCGVHETSGGHNLEDRNQCGFTGPGDHINTPPMLGQLAAIPNATSTLELMPGSTAINGGDTACTSATGAPLTHDQRGLMRPQGSACDIGAFEFQLPVFSSPPALSGGPEVGQPLSCTPAPAPSSPDGPATVGGAVLVRDGAATTTAFPYTIVASDAGHMLACGESATDAAGTVSTSSPAITAITVPTPTTTTPVQPSNAFAVVSTTAAADGGKLTIALVSPDAGKFIVTATATVTTVHSGRKHRTMLAYGSATATAGGPEALVLKLTPTVPAEAALDRAGKLIVPLKITFTPTGGTSRTRIATVSVRDPRANLRHRH